MQRSVLMTAAAALLVACDSTPMPVEPADVGAPAFRAITLTINQFVPFASVVSVPCARGGAGEMVELTGTLHVLIHETVSEFGNVHAKFHFQPQGVSGRGLSSGDRYRATGVTQGQSSSNAPLPITQTFINNFRIIGPGPGNNLMVHQIVHVTMNANGVFTSTVDRTRVTCK